MRRVRHSIAFDAVTWERLHRAFEVTGIPETAIVRKAVAQYLDGPGKPEEMMERIQIRLALQEGPK